MKRTKKHLLVNVLVDLYYSVVRLLRVSEGDVQSSFSIHLLK